MKALLQKTCPTCTASSVQTYYYNIKALAKMAGYEEPPKHGRWINKSLLGKIRKLPLMKFKNMTIAGIKALNAYGIKNEEWAKAMTKSTERYNKERDKQKRTPKEARNWPDGGYKALAKLAGEMRGEVAPLFKKAPAAVTLSELWKMARWFLILFYSKHALRGDIGDMHASKKGQNYIVKKGKRWHMHIGNHKTVKSHGAIELETHAEVSKALDEYLPYLRAKTNHGFLISTKRGGRKMSRKDMMELIRNTTEARLGKRIGVQLIRVLKTTEHFKSIDESAQLRGELAHGPQMQWKYVSRR
ncbi:MAG: hypothetical protein MK236_10745 [Pedosphaera sp.]|nr:hypothetical protein [Pedosphaera sp.]